MTKQRIDKDRSLVPGESLNVRAPRCIGGATDSMIPLATLRRLLTSIGIIIALVVPPISFASGQSSCQMVCAKGKRTCHSCCAGDLSCGVSKSRSDAPHSVTATQAPIRSGASCQAVLTRTVLFVLPSAAGPPPKSVTRGFKLLGDYLAANCILLI